MGWLRLPLLARRGVGIEDRPDRSAAIELLRIAGPGERRRVILIVAGRRRLVIEAQAVLLDEDQVLVVPDEEPERLGAEEMRGGRVKIGSGAVDFLAHAALGEQVIVLR